MADKKNSIEMSTPQGKSTHLFSRCYICQELLNGDVSNCVICKRSAHNDCLTENSRTSSSSGWRCELCTRSATQKTTDLEEKSQASSKHSSSSSRCSTRKKRELLLQKLEEEKQLDKKYLDKKYQVLEELASSDEESFVGTVNNKKKDVEEWLQKVESSRLNNNLLGIPHDKQIPPTRALNASTEPFYPNNQSQLNSSYRLSREDIAARHETKCLPSFNGDFSDWPIFYSAFISSTNKCKFDNYENMSRLREALKGEARTSVEALLVNENNVPDVMNTLKMLYGRKEYIISSLIAKVKNTKSVKMENLSTLISFYTSVSNLVANIKSFEMISYLEDGRLLQELLEKLPNNLKLDWGTFKIMSPEVNLNSFNEWLRIKAEAACEVRSFEGKESIDELKVNKTKSRSFLNVHDEDQQDSPLGKLNGDFNHKCIICGHNCRSVKNCPTFLAANYNNRKRSARRLRLCYLCLERHHYKTCNSNEKCSYPNCSIRHHELLHNPDYQNEKPSSTNSNVVAATQDDCNNSKVIYRIVPVTLYGERKSINTYAFLDEGSALTLLDEEIAKFLELTGEKSPLCLRWTGNVTRMENESKVVSLSISGGQESQNISLSNVRTVSALGLPTQSLDEHLLKTNEHLKNLPIISYSFAQPKILIGLNNCKLGITQKVRYSRDSGLVATKTALGWIVHGITNKHGGIVPEPSLNVHQCECDLHNLVKSHFALENFGLSSTTQLPSLEDEKAIFLLNEFSRRVGKNFETCLLWKADDISLPNNYDMAIKRHMSLEKRMLKDPSLAETMEQQIREYIDNKYIRIIPKEELEIYHPRTWYLPIFPVVNANKPGKVRIVWDAAATFKGVSLNSKLLKGPDQLTSLVGVLFRFREHHVAVAADIKQMFHQIFIRKEDRFSQRFLWRKSSQDVLQVYEMMVMTFGACCSPSSAQFIKNLNAEEFRSNHSEAVDAVILNHYVDDYLDSFPCDRKAIQIAKEVQSIHRNGGFQLRNWISNSSVVLKNLEEESPHSSKSMNMSSGISDKVLGLWWSTVDDSFHFMVKRDSDNADIMAGKIIPTKRQVLSTAMKVFDPLGLLGHIIIFLKIILKRVWKAAVEWDEPINEDSYCSWLLWLKVIPSIEDLKVPRCYLSSNEKVQLHVFVDASIDAIAAVAYFRNGNEGGEVSCSIVASKTRVTPTKIVSMPRLELQAAVLGVRLAKFIQKEHRITIVRRIFWSDSKTVLSWLKRDHTIFKQFVAFRVSEILEESQLCEWKYVNTSDNVADFGTKWKTFPNEDTHSIWFNGPSFLRRPESEWCDATTEENDVLESCELLHHQTAVSYQVVDPSRFSKWLRMVRAVAFVLRFLRCSGGVPRNSINLQQIELQFAESVLFRQAQHCEYKSEILLMEEDLNLPIEKRRSVSKQSSLYQLCPFLDENHVIRMQGRINLSTDADYNVMHPIILPRRHPITRLLVTFYHEKYGHANTNTVANELKQKYCIPRMKTLIYSVRSNCQMCKVNNAAPRQPIMSDLPRCRLSIQTRPFTYIGIDYFGPMRVIRGRVLEKRWGVLITCLTVRAVHIEVAESLSTDSCILALSRFMARRGVPLEVFCDNGTNFRGIENELALEVQKVDQNILAERFTTSTTKWNFNPPASPHMGGSWERMVRSIKKAMYEIFPKMPRNPSNELLLSIMVAAENVVNSRPLTYVPVETLDSEILTPNHFLLGSSNGIRVVGEFNDESEVLRKNWQILQQQQAAFSRRWIKEILPTLTRRVKWFEHSEPLKVGDLVIIIDNMSPIDGYRRGIVTEIYIGKNNAVRSAKVKTQSGELIRPVVKLAVIDVSGTLIQDQVPGGSIKNTQENLCSALTHLLTKSLN